MSIKELNGWAEYLSREPVYSVEAQLAGILQITSQINGGKMKFDEAHFTKYKKTPEPQSSFMSSEDVANALRAFAK